MGIDIVITWVDGNDPKHRAKRNSYLTDSKESVCDDIAGATRYNSVGEIEICVASILRYAPFVRTIFIVTDSQNPELEVFVEENFPESTTNIKIVDHREIFRGYEAYLPTFNSLSIETMLWRIEGLSERFVYLNDDMFLLGEVTENDWFEGGSLVSYGAKFSSRAAKFLRWVKPKRGGRKPFGYKDAMVNAASMVSSSYFRLFPHAPTAQFRSVLRDYFEAHPEAISHNIKHRVRESSQYNPQTLCQLLSERDGHCHYQAISNRQLFINHAHREGYVARKLKEADANCNLLCGCANSLDKASSEDLALFKGWMERRIGVKFTR